MRAETVETVMARITLPGDPLSVRNGLRALFALRLLRDLTEEARCTVELVLAEALNNIVEHAYARQPGEIELTLQLNDDALWCRIVDSGAVMPGGALPPGAAPQIGASAALPEGGFGWFLIRSLARDLAYQRIRNCNHLSFRLEAKQSAH